MTIVEKMYFESIDRIKQSGAILVDKSEWDYRLNNCKKCEYYQTFSENKEDDLD